MSLLGRSFRNIADVINKDAKFSILDCEQKVAKNLTELLRAMDASFFKKVCTEDTINQLER